MVPSAQDRVRADDAAALIVSRLTALVAWPPDARTLAPEPARAWLDEDGT